MQTLSSVAPPPIDNDAIDASADVTTFIPSADRQKPLRVLGWAMVIGGTVALALVLIMPKLRSAPAPQQLAAPPSPPAPAAVAVTAAQVQEAPPAPVEPRASTSKARGSKRALAAEAPAAEAKQTNIRIRARVAPVRAAPEAKAKVVCSVKRGTVMHSYQQTAGGNARWFAVHCDKDSPGWLHENFLTPIKP